MTCKAVQSQAMLLFHLSARQSFTIGLLKRKSRLTAMLNVPSNTTR